MKDPAQRYDLIAQMRLAGLSDLEIGVQIGVSKQAIWQFMKNRPERPEPTEAVARLPIRVVSSNSAALRILNRKAFRTAEMSCPCGRCSMIRHGLRKRITIIIPKA